MRKEPSIDKWLEGLQIKKLNVWEYLWDVDLMSVKLPEMKEPCYCSVLGRGSDCCGSLIERV